MDLRADTREFLVSRRGRITPERAGLPAYGGNRSVPGLRREEVAMLAGVSVDYYTRLERGNLSGVSEEVLEALAEALQLDDAERAHLFDLARAANTSGAARSRARRTAPPVLRPVVQRILDSLEHAPAFVRNGRLDVLGTNLLGRALYAPLFDSPSRTPGRPVNTARFHFLDPDGAAAFWGDRADRMAHDAVAILRAEAGRNPGDRKLMELVGELSTRSEDFRRMWASHDVRFHRSGTKVFHHPAIGLLELDYEALVLPADPGLQLNVYSAVPGSPVRRRRRAPRVLGRDHPRRPPPRRREPRDGRGVVGHDPDQGLNPCRSSPSPPPPRTRPSGSRATCGSTRSPPRRTPTSA